MVTVPRIGAAELDATAKPTAAEAVPPVSASVPKASPPPKSVPPFDVEAIFRSLRVSIDPPPTGMAYRVWSLLVTIVMIVLPLIYVAFIAAVGGVIYWHLTQNTGMLNVRVRGKGYLFVILAYVAPAIVGGFMILFMLKPLFARPAKHEDGYQLDPQKEPVLYEFITRICNAIGAPRPSLIEITMDVNAAAGPRHGLFSLLRRDLRLVIGLPLVAGSTVQQLGGILAHEFGHFSQSGGMVLSNIIRRISMWFTRVVYERDEWDEWLVNTSKETDLRLGWVLYLARLGVWVSRKLLHGLMYVSWAVSGRLSQQMEYDADRYGMKIAGSKNLEATALLLPVLDAGHQTAINSIGAALERHEIVDDFPRLIALTTQALPDNVVKEIRQHALDDETSWFSTHPASKDRIASARAEDEPGVLRAKQPASVLFRDFGEFSRRFTKHFYKTETTLELKKLSMVSADEVFRADEEQRSRTDAAVAYATTSIPLSRPIRWGDDVLDPVTDLEAARTELASLRQQIMAIRPAVVKTYNKLDKSRTELFIAGNMLALHDCELASKKLDACYQSRDSTLGVTLKNQDRIKRIAAQLDEYESLLGARATLGLRVWQTTTNDPRREKVGEWLQTLGEMQDRRGRLDEMAIDLERMRFVLENLGQYHEDERVVRGVHKIGRELAAQARDLFRGLHETHHPFVPDSPTIASTICENVPELDGDPIGTFQFADSLIDATKSVQARLILHLFSFAAEGEQHLGLDPLPPVEDEEEGEAE